MLSTINNNGSNIVAVLNTRYTKTEVDGLISTSHTKAETDSLLDQKVDTSGNSVFRGSLEDNAFRCGEIEIINDDGLNSLALTQFSANRSIIGLRTEESHADVYLNAKGFSYVRLSTTNNITTCKDTTIDENLTTGSTTINCDLTVNGFFAYAGEDSYTHPEIDDFLVLKIGTTGNTTINGYVAVICNSTYNGDSSSDSYTKTETYNKLFFKVNQSHGEIHSTYVV